MGAASLPQVAQRERLVSTKGGQRVLEQAGESAVVALSCRSVGPREVKESGWLEQLQARLVARRGVLELNLGSSVSNQ